MKHLPTNSGDETKDVAYDDSNSPFHSRNGRGNGRGRGRGRRANPPTSKAKAAKAKPKTKSESQHQAKTKASVLAQRKVQSTDSFKGQPAKGSRKAPK